MATDYRKFKTPFYEIKVGDSSGQRMVAFPHHLLRLVERIEILETYEPGSFSTITLTIVEGSREPASQDPTLGTNGLYKMPNASGRVDLDISGSLTNRTGVIPDLRFSGNSGITFITAAEAKKGAVSTTIQKNVVDKNTTRKVKNEPKSPVFLFQQRNQIQVTWGYLEDKSSIRSVRGYVAMITTNFPENAMPVTTVTCYDTGGSLDQIAPKKGVPFGRRVPNGSGFTVSFDDMDTDALIRDITGKLGLPAIISQNLPASKLEKDRQKIWIAGQSFQQFMEKLAAEHNAYYKVIPDPKTGVDTLVFITKKDFESKAIISDPNLLTYKAPGSILKSVNVNVDYGGIGSATHGDATGGSHTSSDGEQEVVLFEKKASKTPTKKEQLIDIDPTSNNPVKAAQSVQDKLLDGDYTGIFEANPVESEGNLKDRAKVDAEYLSRNVILDIITQGHTRLTPGVVEIGGIGVRYSGKYRLQTVTHTIDGNGYNCRATGMSYTVPTGGVNVPDAQKGAEDSNTVDVNLFTPKRENSSDAGNKAIRDQLNKFIYKSS